MKLGIYALRDKKAFYFNHLDLFENDYIALREYTLMLDRQKASLSDYDILYLGTVNTTSELPLIESEKLSVLNIEKIRDDIQSKIKSFEELINAKGL